MSRSNLLLRSPFIKFCWVEISLPKSLNRFFWGLSHTPEHEAPERFWPVTPIPLQAVSECNDSAAPSMVPSPFTSQIASRSFLGASGLWKPWQHNLPSSTWETRLSSLESEWNDVVRGSRQSRLLFRAEASPWSYEPSWVFMSVMTSHSPWNVTLNVWWMNEWGIVFC